MSAIYNIKLKRNIHLAVQEEGDPNGYPILYIHGTPGSKKEIEYLADAAERNGLRLIAFDRPGLGDSEFYPYTPATLSKDIDQILDRLEIEDYACLAYSAGAMYMSDHFLLSSKPPKALFDIAGWVPVSIDNTLFQSLSVFDKVALRKVKDLPKITSVPQFMLSRAFKNNPDDKRLSQSLAKMALLMGKTFDGGDPDFTEFFASNVRFAMHSDTKGAAYALGHLFEEPQCRPENISTPYHSWHGTADDYVPFAFARYKQEKIPDFHLHPLEGERHFQPLTHKDEIMDEIQSVLSAS